MATIEQLAGASVVYERIKKNHNWEINNVWIKTVDVEGKRIFASYDREHFSWYFERTFRHWRIRYPRLPHTK